MDKQLKQYRKLLCLDITELGSTVSFDYIVRDINNVVYNNYPNFKLIQEYIESLLITPSRTMPSYVKRKHIQVFLDIVEYHKAKLFHAWLDDDEDFY